MNSASRSFSGVGRDDPHVSVGAAHRHVRGDVERVAQLVRDDDRADVLQIAQLDDLLVDGRRGDRVETGGRLVVEQDPRLGGHRARDRDAAALAARELRRHPIDVLRQADEPEHLLDTPVDLVQRHVGLLVQLVADVLADGQRVEQRAFLEHHPEIGAHRIISRFGQLIDALAVHPDDAAVGAQETDDDLQDRRLPRRRSRRG